MIKILRDKKLSAEKLFGEADSSGDGSLDLLELKECLYNIGGFSEKELGAIMNYMDIDGDGNIDRREFISQMKKANKMYDAYW